MSVPFSFVPGWKYEPKEIAATAQRFADAGVVTSFGADKPDLKGLHKSIKVTRNAHAEIKVFGKWTGSWHQNRGTCVAQGTTRAAWTSYLVALARGAIAGDPLSMSVEFTYAGSRVNIGRGQLGRGDGSFGGWAAEFLWKYGIFPRGVYGQWDLSKANEMVGVNLAVPGQGVPESVLKDPRCRKGIRCWSMNDLFDWRDLHASGRSGAICLNTLFAGQRDKNGCCRPSGQGGHCTEIKDYVVLPNGETVYIQQQSWGEGAITGPNKVPCIDGSEYELGPGCCAIYESDLQRAMRGGHESWGFDACDPWTEGIKPGEYA